jgi:putative sterol carrier protein
MRDWRLLAPGTRLKLQASAEGASGEEHSPVGGDSGAVPPGHGLGPGRTLARIPSDYLAHVATYLFLSDEWIEAAKAIRDEYRGKVRPMAHAMKMNQVITDVPFGTGTIESHMDTTSGEIQLEFGHLESPDLTVTMDYATAKAIIVEGNPAAGMQAFMAGKIRVQGDMSKLMAMQQSAEPDPVAAEAAARIQAITE